MTNEELRDYIDDMLTRASQQADADTINLSSRFEAFKESANKKEASRWSWFRWITGIVVGSTLMVAVIVYDKLHDTLFSMDTRLGRIEQQVTHTTTKEELARCKIELLEKIHRTKDEILFKRRSTDENFNSGRRPDTDKHMGTAVW